MVPAWLQARGCHCHGAVGTLPLTFHVDRGTVAFLRLRVGHRRDLGLLDFPSRLGCPRSGSCSTVTSLSQTCPLPPQPNLAREPRGKLAWRPWAFPFLPTLLFLPFPHPTPPSPGTLSLFHLWVGFVIWQGRGWQQTLSHQLAQLHTSVMPWPQCPGIPLSHTYPK